MTEPSDLESHFKPAAEIWRLGCTHTRQENMLDEQGLQKFTAMARSRFHTFQLSITHAQTTGNGTKVAALLRGLAIELEQAPGLTEQWQASEFSADDFGSQVTAYLHNQLPESNGS